MAEYIVGETYIIDGHERVAIANDTSCSGYRDGRCINARVPCLGKLVWLENGVKHSRCGKNGSSLNCKHIVTARSYTNVRW